MIDYPDLPTLSFKAERAASRRLARETGMSIEAALRITLEQIAGPAGMEALVAARRALQALDQQRIQSKQERAARERSKRSSRHLDQGSAWQGWFDGSAHPNPGRCGVGALLVAPSGERIEISHAAGYGNSSEAEYQALIALLRAALAAGAHDVTLYGDSRVVIDDVNGPDASASPSLSAWRTAARELIGSIGGITVRWLPRRKNAEADALSQRAIAEWAGGACDAP